MHIERQNANDRRFELARLIGEAERAQGDDDAERAIHLIGRIYRLADEIATEDDGDQAGSRHVAPARMGGVYGLTEPD